MALFAGRGQTDRAWLASRCCFDAVPFPEQRQIYILSRPLMLPISAKAAERCQALRLRPAHPATAEANGRGALTHPSVPRLLSDASQPLHVDYTPKVKLNSASTTTARRFD